MYNEKNSFILYLNYKRSLVHLSDEERGRVFLALFDYVEGKEITGLSRTELIVLGILAGKIDEDRKKWEETRKKRSAAGKKGAAVKKRMRAKQ